MLRVRNSEQIVKMKTDERKTAIDVEAFISVLKMQNPG